jgi:hypothetical protein
MRFMMLLKADKTTEAGVLPTQADLAVMGRWLRRSRRRARAASKYGQSES